MNVGSAHLRGDSLRPSAEGKKERTTVRRVEATIASSQNLSVISLYSLISRDSTRRSAGFILGHKIQLSSLGEQARLEIPRRRKKSSFSPSARYRRYRISFRDAYYPSRARHSRIRRRARIEKPPQVAISTKFRARARVISRERADDNRSYISFCETRRGGSGR